MKDKAFLNEFRKKVLVLQSRYDVLKRDLDAARIVLAMLERESVSGSQDEGNLSHTDFVADCIVDILSLNREMHRLDILEYILERGVHVGYEDDKQKQLSGLSTLLSKDSRFSPVKGRSGYWTLTKFLNPEFPVLKADSIITADTPPKSKDEPMQALHREKIHPFMPPRYKKNAARSNGE